MNELRWETTPALEHGKRMIYGDYSCIDAIAFSPFHYLESRFFRRSYLSYSFFFFFHDHVVPCIFLSGPWKSLSLSLSLFLFLSPPLFFFPRVTLNLESLSFRASKHSPSLFRRRVGKVAASWFLVRLPSPHRRANFTLSTLWISRFHEEVIRFGHF